MKKTASLIALALSLSASAQSFHYDLSSRDGQKYNISEQVPDGNYRVTVTLGSKKKAGSTVVRGESRRLFIENEVTKKKETKVISFLINKRNTKISDKEVVRIKDREKTKLNWDDELTLEITGDYSTVQSIDIERDETAPTIFLCGNSTVVDQDEEPWASWGQMIPRWLNDKICVANYAESGETASTFIGAGRLKKALTQMKKGDYIFMEFGHNDQKQKGPGTGAYYNFATALKTFIDEARQRGATPVFVTPTQRRSFKNGKIEETHANYPEAMKWVAEREKVALIDLHEMTRTFYEAMGEEASKRAFVHYPANTYPGQHTALADNTHFNPYGAYELAKCIIEGWRTACPELMQYVRPEYQAFDPAHPDDRDAFHWVDSEKVDIIKPDGN